MVRGIILLSYSYSYHRALPSSYMEIKMRNYEYYLTRDYEYNVPREDFMGFLARLSESDLDTNDSDAVLLKYVSSNGAINEQDFESLAEHRRKLKAVNDEIRQRLTFEKSGFRKIYLISKLVPDTRTRPVFSKCIENKYLEKVTVYDDKNKLFLNEGYNSVSEKVLETIQSVSALIEVNWSSISFRAWSDSVLNVLRLPHIPKLSNVDIDIAQQVMVEIFAKDYDIYLSFINCLNNIDELSLTLYSGILFKLATKLTPLLAVQIFNYFKSDVNIKSFFRDKKAEIFFRNKYPTATLYAQNVKSYLMSHRKAVTRTTFIGLGVFGYTTYKRYNPTTGEFVSINENALYPSVQAFVDVMESIRKNSMAITFSITRTFGDTVNSAYKGLRQSLIESGMVFVRDLINIISPQLGDRVEGRRR
jgi:hypothetical protein